MEKIKAGEILKEIRNNTKKLDGCKRHKFSGEQMPPGSKYTCLNCGGEIRGGDVLYYIAGYEAAGGNCDDIYPGWRDDTK